MTYNSGVPRAYDIPAYTSQEQFLANFQILNESFGNDHVPFANSVVSVTQDTITTIRSPLHGLVTGDTITIYSFKGQDSQGISEWSINGNSYVVTVLGDNRFTIPVDTTLEPPYIRNTGDFTISAFPYGYHTKLTYPNPKSSDPNLSAPKMALYTKFAATLVQSFFQNDLTTASVNQLSGIELVQTPGGIGFKTPWGLIINCGEVEFGQPPITITFPIPFTTIVYTVIATANSKTRAGVAVDPSNVTLTDFIGATASASGVTVPTFYFALGQ